LRYVDGAVQPVGWLVTAPDAGRSPEVQVFDAQSGILRFDITAFDPSFQGGVRVAVGDVNGDGIPDIITAEGPGAGTSGDSLVHVFDGITGQPLAGPLGSFDPFPDFHGGMYVAAADLTGDGYADVLVGQDAGGQGWVNIYSGQTGGLLAQFQPFGSFAGGVRLAAGPVASNGHVDLIAGAGPGGQPQVEVFDGPSLVGGLDTAVASFDAFDPRFTGGVYVAAGLLHGQGQPPGEIIVGEGAGGEPRVSGTARHTQGDLAGALADLDQTLELNPSYPEGYNNRGATRQARGDLPGALADFNKAVGSYASQAKKNSACRGWDLGQWRDAQGNCTDDCGQVFEPPHVVFADQLNPDAR
jgi:hypothetical protein